MLLYLCQLPIAMKTHHFQPLPVVCRMFDRALVDLVSLAYHNDLALTVFEI